MEYASCEPPDSLKELSSEGYNAGDDSFEKEETEQAQTCSGHDNKKGDVTEISYIPSSPILQEPARRPAAYIPVRSGLIRIPLPDDSSFLGRFSGHPPP